MSEAGQIAEPKRRHFDGWVEEIAWLINDAPRELGVRGITVDPSGGGGSMQSDTFHHHLRRHKAGAAVRRWRRAMAVWQRLVRQHQDVLAAAYTQRRSLAVHGAEATFGTVVLAGVALVTEPELELLVEALRDHTNAKHRPIITRARKRADTALRAAHEAWQDGWRESCRRAVEDEPGGLLGASAG